MLVRDTSFYLCHNVQVRLLHHVLFFTFPANTLHPSPLAHPSVLSGAAGAACVAPFLGNHLRYINAWPAKYISFLTMRVSLGCSCNDAAYYSIFHPRRSYVWCSSRRSPFSHHDTGMLWGANTMRHEGKVGRAQGSQIHSKPWTMQRPAGCNWSF